MCPKEKGALLWVEVGWPTEDEIGRGSMGKEEFWYGWGEIFLGVGPEEASDPEGVDICELGKK